MPLPKRFHPQQHEPGLRQAWQDQGVYHYDPQAPGPVYSIDTPPPTVSGRLHMGHVFSYSHADFLARFWRMRGHNVHYPMGFDDNGLPTERLVERQLGQSATEIGRQAFRQHCLQVSRQAEAEYRALWERLGLSIDWRSTYQTYEPRARRLAQEAFLALHQRGLTYRQEAPTIWCPECQTAIAQAEVNDLDRQATFLTLAFTLEDGSPLPIATTRPELLPACVAVFVHPEDERYRHLPGSTARVPLSGQSVPILSDPAADPHKGTGVVMCCTFGDQTDVAWWRAHDLPLIMTLDRDGRLNAAAGDLAGLPVPDARRNSAAWLESQGLVLARTPTGGSVRVHERCDTPVEYIVTPQWFIRVLDFKAPLLEAGDRVRWHPALMQNRYRDWVQNLAWDWCISRQRHFGVPFPLWHCQDCDEVLLAEADQLPVDPQETPPPGPCTCGSRSFRPETDVLDTWATSSLSPLIAAGWTSLAREDNPPMLFPATLRPQAHEIIRTWAFYTLVQSHFHFEGIPWREVLISGWGVAGEGQGKVSKSRGGGSLDPQAALDRYGADAVRYWAASTSPGKDAIISEEKIQLGARLVTKLWNVARFSQPFLLPAVQSGGPPPLSPADRWLLSSLQTLVRRTTQLLEGYEYAAAKSELESFFWGTLSDNYLEMAKQRLYDGQSPMHAGARFSLDRTLLTILKLFAPFLPYVTDALYQELFARREGGGSLHRSPWPQPDPALEDEESLQLGAALVAIAGAVRRYKSERSLPLGRPLERVQLALSDPALAGGLAAAAEDLRSITRAEIVEVVPALDPALEPAAVEAALQVGIQG